jgi:exodeoxyribonuclease-3
MLRDLLVVREATQPVMLGGDFNIALSDLDVYDPAALEGMTHVSEPERAALREVLSTGLVDLGRSVTHEPSFTWWDYRNGSFHRGWGLRIDYLLADAATAQRVQAVEVDQEARKGEKPSDHAPVVATFDWAF